VSFLADQDGDAWGPGEPVAIEVPTRGVEHGFPPGGEADEVRHGGARRESHVAARRQSEQLEQPIAGGLFEGSR
jgi:hypothetical protein